MIALTARPTPLMRCQSALSPALVVAPLKIDLYEDGFPLKACGTNLPDLLLSFPQRRASITFSSRSALRVPGPTQLRLSDAHENRFRGTTISLSYRDFDACVCGSPRGGREAPIASE